MLPLDTRRSEFIFFLQLNTVENLWGDWLLVTTSPRSQWNLCTQELFLSGLRLVMFLAELNKLLLWGGDVGNAYRQVHIPIIYKALYGARMGGACWHVKLFDTLQLMGFQPSKADPDIWMKPTDDGQAYEYIAAYVDDLCVVSKDPGKIFQTLKNKYKFKLKGDGPLDYHLGCSFDTLQLMGFQPSKADPDIWMKLTDDRQTYEYIAVYVDGLCVVSKDPGKIFQTLKNKYKFKLKGDGPLDYHLGCSFDTLQLTGFQPSKADPDIWMKPTDNGQAYEYIAVYVDDLCVVSKDPGKIFQTLKNKYKFKLK